jgi:hypothetical protein
MTELSLMYVALAKDDCLTLSEVGTSIGLQITVSLPADIMRTLVGRHVWIKGGWGDCCVIHSWPSLPKAPEIENKDDE